MKMENIKLSEEALAFKSCFVDMNEMMTSQIQTACKLACLNVNSRNTLLISYLSLLGLLGFSSAFESLIVKQQLDFQENLKTKFVEGAKERKELYNKMLELKGQLALLQCSCFKRHDPLSDVILFIAGNIRVFCRCRPLNTEEIASGAPMVVDFESAKDGELIVKSNGAPKRVFKFDAVFGPQANQGNLETFSSVLDVMYDIILIIRVPAFVGDVFEDTAPFAASVLDGYNVCIFAYGQTGTGKTFTMEGTEGARGVNYRILEELFRLTKERQKLNRYKVSVSVLEVYNEQIRDLLVSGSQSGNGVKR